MEKYGITTDGGVPEPADIAGILRGTEFEPMPRAADREAWSGIADRPWIRELVPGLLERAREVAETGPGQVRATDYLYFARTGSRDAFQKSAGRRLGMVSLLTAAECLEHEGRFLDALLDLSWSIAEETSWIVPPHLHNAGGDVLPDVVEPPIDLRVADVAAVLSEMLYLLGPEMDAVTPRWRKRIVYEVKRQAIDPYLTRTFFWEDVTFNWNAVCNSGVVTAALLAEFDADVQARVLHKALKSVASFLSGFTADGGCSEGPGYWVYGMSNYARMAYYVDCATAGRINLLADPVLPAVFAYPTKVILSGSKIANFADCPPNVTFTNGPVAWAAQKLAVDDMVALATGGPGLLGRRGGPRGRLGTRPLNLCLMPEARPFELPKEAFLADLMVAVIRGSGAEGEQLVLAAKGGHNGEHHNHNDVGNFIVHWRGESLICDLGSGKYVKEFFGPRRYEFLTTRSFGHGVPVISGVEQATGRDFCVGDFAIEKTDDSTGVNMDLTGAYPPEAGLKSLRRRVRLCRAESEFVELQDEVQFAGDAGAYELPLYTEGTFEKLADGVVEARGQNCCLRVQFDPQVVEAEVEMVEHGDGTLHLRYGGSELPRCTLRLRGKRQSASIRVRFEPVN